MGNKEGKVSVEFLIGMIILVISFVVILYFILVAEFGSGINRETCHTSIILRATSNLNPSHILFSSQLKSSQ